MAQQSQSLTRHLTEEDYLVLERDSDTKHEYFEGQVFALPSTSFNHRIVAGNLNRHLGHLLKGNWNVGKSDLRVKVEATGLLTYPDAFAVRGDLTLVHEPAATLLNPSFIAEITSSRSELYDRSAKFEHYQQIPTLSTYLLLSESFPRVEQYVRETANKWTYCSVSGPHATMDLPVMNITISLAEIYAGVEFSESADCRRPLRRRG
jgi:Uma2 family endonuclease